MQLHGDTAVLDAIRRANAVGVPGAEYVAQLLGEHERMSRPVMAGEEVAE